MKAILSFSGRYPFFLFLLPAFVVIHFKKEFYGIVNYGFIFDRILILFAVPVLSFLFFYPFFRSAKKASLMTLGLLLVFYYTGEMKNWLSVKFPDSSILYSYSFLLSVSAVVLLFLFFILKKSKSELNRPNAYANTLLFLLIVVDVFSIIINPSTNKYKIVSEAEIKNTGCDSCIKPDIYYFLTDAYTSSETLTSEYGFSNVEIEKYLRSKDFIIIPHSKSNYNYTAYSMASIFNMNYIENVDTVNKTTDREYLEAVKLSLKNRVFSFFQKENYRIFNHSIFDFDGYPTTIPDIDYWGLRILFDQYNLVIKLFQDIGYHFPAQIKKLTLDDRYYVNSIQNRLKFSQIRDQHLAETIKLECSQPKFVYAHFLRLHPPYFFDSTGQFSNNAHIEKADAYIQQVIHLNGVLEKTVDNIMSSARRPTIIIIQGDHGISFSEPPKQQDWFPNFSAIYFSNKDYRLFNDSTNNVNTFRIVLNTFFKKDMKLLPYRSYFLKWW